jgi:hypothetical protein
MNTAGRENPNRWATRPRNRAHGAGGQNRSCSSRWAEKQENSQPAEKCFFLTSPFIELSSGYVGKIVSLASRWKSLPRNTFPSKTFDQPQRGRTGVPEGRANILENVLAMADLVRDVPLIRPERANV